jgi:hypothetical protein
LSIAVVIKQQIVVIASAQRDEAISATRVGSAPPVQAPIPKGNAAVWRNEPEVFAPKAPAVFFGFDPDQRLP